MLAAEGFIEPSCRCFFPGWSHKVEPIRRDRSAQFFRRKTDLVQRTPDRVELGFLVHLEIMTGLLQICGDCR